MQGGDSITTLSGATLSISGTPGKVYSNYRQITNGYLNHTQSGEVISTLSPTSFGSITVAGMTFSNISISYSNTSSYTVYGYVSGTLGSSTGTYSGTIGTISVTTSKGNSLSATIRASVRIDEPATPTYTHTAKLNYNANNGSGAPSTQSDSYTSTSSSPSGSHSFTISSTKPTRSGYSFLGWSTSSSATTASYQPGSTISVSYGSSTTLYAVWKETTYTSTLKFDANGGTGAPSVLTHTGTSTSAHTFTIPSTVPTRSGYAFLGWATSSSATTASYQSGNTISVAYNGTTTLYAVWQRKPTWIKVHSGSGWTSASDAFVKTSGGWKSIKTTYIKVDGEWVDAGAGGETTENNWDMSKITLNIG